MSEAPEGEGFQLCPQDKPPILESDGGRLGVSEILLGRVGLVSSVPGPGLNRLCPECSELAGGGGRGAAGHLGVTVLFPVPSAAPLPQTHLLPWVR